RRYDRARSLLVGQPWLDDYAGGEALAVLAEAEARLGLATAPGHYAAARARATGARAALLAVREGLAWETVGEVDSAAAAYAAAAVGVARAGLGPRTPPEYVAIARAMKSHGGAADARLEVERALRQGDSSAATLVLAGELFAGAGRYREAERAYRAAARDSE